MITIDPKQKISELLKAHPAALDFLMARGLKALGNPIMRKAMAGRVSLEDVCKMHHFDLDAMQQGLVRYLEESAEGLPAAAGPAPVRLGVPSEKAQAHLRVEGVLPCPIRLPLMEAYENAIQGSSGLFTDLRAASMGVDFLAKQCQEKKLEALPDVIVSAGFELFFNQNHLASFLKAGDYAQPMGPMNTDFDNAQISLRDPKGQLAILAVVPAVLMVNKDVLGDRSMPRTWEDLLTPAFENSLAIPLKDLDLFNAVLLHIYRRFGLEGIDRLARAHHRSLHPAEMVKLGKRAKAPCVNVTPYFFAKMLKENDPTVMVWPEDGAIVSPVFMTTKRGKEEAAKTVVDFFLSQKAGELMALQGYFPSTNPAVDNHLSTSQGFDWLGFDFLHREDVGSLLASLEARFQAGITP